MKDTIKRNTTSYSTLLFMTDLVAESGVSGLAHTDIQISYMQLGVGNGVVMGTGINPDTLNSIADGHSGWAFKECDYGFAPGWYRFDIADEVIASGTELGINVMGTGGANVKTEPLHFKIAAGDLETIYNQNVAIQGSGWNPDTDSNQELRDRGDLAWKTATAVQVSDKTGFKLAHDGMDIPLGSGRLTLELSAMSGVINRIVIPVCGIASSGGTGVEVFTYGSGTPNTLIATVDASGNRTNMTWQ